MRRLDLFPNNDLISLYRQVFSSGAGMQVLSHMLYDLGVFVEITEGAEDVALKNYGTRLVNILAGGEPSHDSIEQFTNRLMKQPLPKPVED